MTTKDTNGSELKEGDAVIVRGKVRWITPNEEVAVVLETGAAESPAGFYLRGDRLEKTG